jgi:adenylyl cyclase-associated protein
MTILTGVSENMKAIGKVVKRNDWEKHVKGMQEATACLNFLAIKNPPPRDYVKSQIGSSNFHTDKVRVQYRPSSATPKPEHVLFCDTLKALMEDLVPYVKEYHTTGLTWNPNGAEAGSAPPPAPAPSSNPSSSGGAAKIDMAAALAKGGAGATAGLKHVDKKEVAAAAPKPVPTRSAPKAKVAEGPKGEAKCELTSGMGGAKWDVQYQSGICEVKPNSTKEMVYIYGCVGAGIDIQADCRNVVIENCQKTRVFLNSALASVEVVNCKRQYVNVRNKVPTMSIDNSDNVQVFLSAEAMAADIELTTSKSSEMNVQWEKGEDIIEKPIPEQFKHKIVDGAITVEVSDLYK